MDSEIVIREAKLEDTAARAQLVERAITSYDQEAFFFFVFQEVSVLAAAVMFIFGGASPAASALAPLALGGALALAVRVTHRMAARSAAARVRGELAGFVAEVRGRLVGTVSVSEHRGVHRGGWLHGLAVDARWRRRGAGGALLAAARGGAARAGLRSLELATSALQARATALLHASGWRVRLAYHRRLAGEALTLPMLLMALDLDPQPST